MQRFNLSAWAIAHQPLVLFMILVLAGAGVYSYLNLGRAEDPSFTIKTMVVNAAWPGATAAEMEEQVADPIEKKLQELPYLDRIESYSRPGVTFIRVNLRDSTPPAEVADLWYEVRKKVADIRGSLPSGIIGPGFNDEFGDVYSALYMLSADGMSLADLEDVAEDIRQRLLKVADVNKVDIIGAQPERIYIEFSHAKLATLGVTPAQVFESVARQNEMVPGGSVDTSADRIGIRISGAFKGIEAIAAVPVEAGGRTFRLGDIAEVKLGYEDPAQFLLREGGRPAVAIGVSMEDGANIITLGENLDAAMAAIEAEMPVGIEVVQVADQPHIVDESVSEFFQVFIEALVIVLVVSFLSLGLRTGLVVALSVPLVLAIVFVVMYAMRHGPPPHHARRADHRARPPRRRCDHRHRDDGGEDGAGLGPPVKRPFAWTSTAFPMLTGTLVTAAGFLPVGFANSLELGEYAGGIFWVVGLALIASWFVAVIFTPYLGVKLLPDFARKQGRSRRPRPGRHLRHTALQRPPPRHRLVRRAAEDGGGGDGGDVRRLPRRLRAGPAAVLPDLEPDRAVLPAPHARGHGDRRHRRGRPRGRGAAQGRSRHRHHTTYVGQGSPRFWLGLNPQSCPTRTFAEIVIVTRDLEARERVKARLEAADRRRRADGGAGRGSTASTSARRSASRSSSGWSAPIPTSSARSRRRCARSCAGNPDVIDSHLDWNEQVKASCLEVDQERARALGLTPQDVSQALADADCRAARSRTIRDGIEKVGWSPAPCPRSGSISAASASLTISQPQRRAGAAGQVARLSNTRIEEPILWRRNRDLAITVRADVVDGVQAPDVSATQISPKLEGHRQDLPPGLPHRAGRLVEEIRQGQCVDLHPVPGDGDGDADAADDPVAELLAAGAGVPDRAARHRRRDARAQRRQPAVRLRGAARADRARRHDHAQHGDPGRSDRERRRLRPDPATTAIVEATVRRARPVVLTALGRDPRP
jgi:multidrug efflux pump